MTWLLVLPTSLTIPWVFLEMGSLARLTFAAHVDRDVVRRRRHRGFVAMGAFEVSVAFSIIALGITQHTPNSFSSAFPVAMVGVGFIAAGLWHPWDRLVPHA